MIVHGQQQTRPVSVPVSQRVQSPPSQSSPRSQTRKYIIVKHKELCCMKFCLIYFCGFCFALFVIFYNQVSRAEEKAKRKDRSRSKSPFRSFRWKKGSSKTSGAVSDDEAAGPSGIFAILCSFRLDTSWKFSVSIGKGQVMGVKQ